MKIKIIFSIFVLVLIIVYLEAAGLTMLMKQQPSSPVATTTVQAGTPQSIPTSAECNVSTQNILTSTWKTFRDPQWEIAFQYPPTAQLSAGNGSVGLSSSNGYGLNLRKDYYGSIVAEGGNYPPPCTLTIAGQEIGVTINPYASGTDLGGVADIFVVSKSHDYSFVFTANSSSARRTVNGIINTIQFR